MAPSKSIQKRTKIKLILGPMFSGKSTRLIAEAEKHVRSHQKCIIIRHTIDTRSPENLLKSHGGIIYEKNLQCDIIMTNKLCDILVSIIKNNINIILIDEGQFFIASDFINFIENIYKSANVEKIFISALSGQYNLKIFPTISEILPFC